MRTEGAALRQGFCALLLASAGSFLAGLTLGSMTGTLERLPGLLVLVPAAIGMRGNIFGALGSRLGTAIQAGTFRLSRRRDTLVGQNLWAAIVASLSVSLLLAVLAKAVAIAFGLENTIGIEGFVVISVLGGMLSSVAVMAITVGVAATSVRRGWDLDNVAAPLVTAAGDVVTLPSLLLASYLAGPGWVTTALALGCAVAGVAALVGSARSGLPVLRRILAESLPILALAGLLDVVAGIAIEKRLDSVFGVFPALLVLIPPFLEASGALGGILSSRLATKLHLGLVEPSRLPGGAVFEDVLLVLVFAAPIFFLVGVSADLAAALLGLRSPGALATIGVALVAGTLAVGSAVVVAYYGAVASFRLGLDPDNFGIPTVTSFVDLLGAFSIVIALVMLGIS